MNTVAVIVDSLPNRNLSPEESVIKRLDFLSEIAACERKRGGSHILGVNYLRAIADEVGRRYDIKFNAYRHVVPSDYQGIECHTADEIAAVVRTMFLAKYPQIFDRYLETKFKDRPYGVRVAYFLGPREEATAFNTLGVEVIAAEAVSDYLRGVSGTDVEHYQPVVQPVETTIFTENTPPEMSFPSVQAADANAEEMATLQGLVDETPVIEEKPTTTFSKQEFKQNKKNKKANKNNTLPSVDSEV